MNQSVEIAHQAPLLHQTQILVDIPILANGVSVRSDSMNVAYIVPSYEDAGMIAVCIQDDRFLKTNSLLDLMGW